MPYKDGIEEVIGPEGGSTASRETSCHSPTRYQARPHGDHRSATGATSP